MLYLLPDACGERRISEYRGKLAQFGFQVDDWFFRVMCYKAPEGVTTNGWMITSLPSTVKQNLALDVAANHHDGAVFRSADGSQ